MGAQEVASRRMDAAMWARVAVGAAGVVLVGAGIWASGMIGASMRDGGTTVTTTIVREPPSPAKTTTVTSSATDAPILSGTVALSVVGLGVLLVLIAIAWNRVRKITGPGDWSVELGEAAMASQAVQAALEADKAPEEVMSALWSDDPKAQQARREFHEAAVLQRQGKAAAARETRAGALTAFGQLAPVAEDLERDRGRYSGYEGRIRTEGQLRRVEQFARDNKPSREEVLAQAEHARPEDRVLIIAQMLGCADCADAETIISAIEAPFDTLELQESLRAVRNVLDGLDAGLRARLVKALENQQDLARARGDAYTPMFTVTLLRDLPKEPAPAPSR